MSANRLLLFRLNGVPEAEADAVRHALVEQDIVFYETYAGRWRLGTAAIWLDTKDVDVIARARQAIAEVQQTVLLQAREDYDPKDTSWRRIRQQPWAFVVIMIAVALVLYLTLAPFVGFLS